MKINSLLALCGLTILCGIGCSKNNGSPVNKDVVIRLEPASPVAAWLAPCEYDIYGTDCYINSNAIRLHVAQNGTNIKLEDVAANTDINLGELLPGTYALWAGFVSIDTFPNDTTRYNRVYKHESTFQVFESEGKRITVTSWQ